MDVTPRSLTDVKPAAPTLERLDAPATEAQPGGGDGTGHAAGGGSGRGGGRRRSPWGRARAWVLIAVVLAALGFVVFRGLGNATLFFYNADEAVAKREQLGDDRFRLQGNVVDGTFARGDGFTSFDVSFNAVDVTVHHRGEIPKLFQPGIPVVLEGRWDGDVYASDRMLVKHTEVYVEQNPDRVAGYDEAPAAADPATG